MRFFVYILLCADGSYYTGYTNDLMKRVNTHIRGKGAKYTRARLPVKLHWSWPFNSKSEAMKAEYRVKQMSHTEKKNLDRLYGKAAMR